MKYLKMNRREQDELFGRLESMPDHLSEAFSRLTTEDLKQSGPGGSFSPLEHVWHLVDLEREGFAQRIERLRNETDPFMPDFDGEKAALEGEYNSRSIEKGLAEFRELRTKNVASFRALTDSEWTRRGRQEGVGAVALCDLPSMMDEHDESHRLEIALLSVSRAD